MDRRTTLKWVLAASGLPMLQKVTWSAADAPASGTPRGIGLDPDLLRTYEPGDLWPLTLTAAQRQTAAALCDLIIPVDAVSPSASQVGVVEFIDEWVSAPYDEQRKDRERILAGFAWLDSQSRRHHGAAFHEASSLQQRSICDEICYLSSATPERQEAAQFFARYRDLTAGGFYTTPQGREDVQYVGNVALERFDGPPLVVLKKAGLA